MTPRDLLRSRPTRALAVGGAYAVILGLTYWRLFAAGPERRVFGWDCLEEYWPNLAFQVQALQHGSFPLWNPYDRMGLPFLADPQTGTFHPLQWVLVAAGLLAGHVGPTLMSLKVLLFLWTGAVSMHLLARSWGAPRAGAFVAGISFTLLGGVAFMKDSAIAWPWQMVPLALYAADRALEAPGAARGALLGGALALAGLAGSPPGFFYTLLVVGPYVLVRAWALRPRASALATMLPAAGATALALLAIVYVPTGELAALSDRATRDSGWATQLPIMPADLLGLLVARLREPPPALYAGFLPLLLAAVAIARGGKDLRAAFLAGLFVVALLLALGEPGGLLDKAVAVVPGFSLFRVAERYKLLLTLSVAGLAALGMRALQDGQVAARGVLRGAIVVLAVLGVGLVVGQRAQGAWPAGVALALVVGALSTALFAALARSPAPPAALSTVVVLAVLADAWIAHSDLYRIYEPVPSLEREAAILAKIPGVERDARVWDEFGLEFRSGSRLAIREATGYGALPLLRWKQLADRVDAEPVLLAHFNVRWVLHAPHHRRGFSQHLLKHAPKTGFSVRGSGILEATAVAPVAYWIGDPAIVAAGTDVLGALAKAAPGTRAFVEAPDVPAALRPQLESMRTQRPAVPGAVRALSPNRLTIELDAPASGLVVVNETWYPGWQARVDGRAAPILRANHLVRAVPVEPGHHTIELVFAPSALRWLGPLYVLALLAVLAAGALELQRWRRRMRARSSSIGPA